MLLCATSTLRGVRGLATQKAWPKTAIIGVGQRTSRGTPRSPVLDPAAFSLSQSQTHHCCLLLTHSRPSTFLSHAGSVAPPYHHHHQYHHATHPAVGAAVATNLLRNDVPLVLYDLQGDANVPAPLREKLAGATWAASAAEAAAGSEVVITALPKPEHVSAAFESPGGILEGLQAGTTWIEHSTTDFVNTERVRSLVEAKGAHAVEAPLTGGMQILRAGKMVTLVGADPAVFEGDIASLVVRRGARRAAAVCVCMCVCVCQSVSR